MILVHKQQFPLSSPYSHHRRHPSAPPAVVVQPTKTPGLLSLSKPSQPQQPRQRNSPKPKPAQAVRSPKQAAAPEVNSVLKPSPEISDKKQSPQAGSRGRQQAKIKEKSTRSSSHSAVRGRRINSRQQSPPLPSQTSSQAEAPPSPTYVSSNSNLFDPFLDDTTPINSQAKPVRPTPTLTSRPSGKLAHRRQPNLAPFNPNPTPVNTPSRAIPVPRRFNSYASDLSRSDPVPTRKTGHKSTADVFPICDDMTDSDSEDDSTPPATPTRARHYKKSYDDGPRTAPITTPTGSFPFVIFPAPSSVGRKAGRKHRRVPSEGVFAMSSDEEVAHVPSGATSDELKAFFGLTFKRQSIKPSSFELDKEREAAAGYFASSNFQNSPSPEDLPPPSFV